MCHKAWVLGKLFSRFHARIDCMIDNLGERGQRKGANGTLSALRIEASRTVVQADCVLATEYKDAQSSCQFNRTWKADKVDCSWEEGPPRNPPAEYRSKRTVSHGKSKVSYCHIGMTPRRRPAVGSSYLCRCLRTAPEYNLGAKKKQLQDTGAVRESTHRPVLVQGLLLDVFTIWKHPSGWNQVLTVQMWSCHEERGEISRSILEKARLKVIFCSKRELTYFQQRREL